MMLSYKYFQDYFASNIQVIIPRTRITFKNLNTSTGAISDELIVAKETTLVKIENDPISLSYSGSEINMTFSCLLDSTSKTFKFKINKLIFLK